MRPARLSAGRDRGFALIIVLWALVLVSFIATLVVATGRTEVQIAGNLTANAVTDAAVDGAIYQTVFNLLDPQSRQNWPLDGSVHEFTIGDCRVSVRITDEAGRVNPNVASPALIEALLRVTGSDPASAKLLAAAIGAWVGSPGAAQGRDTLLAEYRAAGLDYGPPGEAMEDLSELRRVLHMTPAAFAALRPHLSLYAPAQPVAASADPIVAAAIAAVTGGEAGRPTLPPAQSAPVTARLAATAQGPANTSAARSAIVRIVPGAGKYTILAWESDDGSL